MITDLARVVDVRYDVQEIDKTTKYHGAKCPGLTNATDYCNFVADGANLCVETHSRQWWSYVACMHEHADPKGGSQMDVNNPLAHVETFDEAMTGCAANLTDYSIDALRTCVYGSEGAALRNVSATKTAADFAAGKPLTVWVEVNGSFVQAPEAMNDTRAEWKKSVVAAICENLQDQRQVPAVARVYREHCASEVAV